MGRLFLTQEEHRAQQPATLGRMLSSPLRRRLRIFLVDGLLKPLCRICQAAPEQGCDYDSPDLEEIVRIDKDPPLWVHTARIRAAIEAGYVKRNTVLEQFAEGGQLPDLAPDGDD